MRALHQYLREMFADRTGRALAIAVGVVHGVIFAGALAQRLDTGGGSLPLWLALNLILIAGSWLLWTTLAWLVVTDLRRRRRQPS